MSEAKKTDTPDVLLDLRDVLGRVKAGKSTWWAGVKSGRYPAPVRIGPRMVRWRSKDINALVENGISVKESA